MNFYTFENGGLAKDFFVVQEEEIVVELGFTPNVALGSFYLLPGGQIAAYASADRIVGLRMAEEVSCS